jgi:hypothetical protein
LIVDIFSEIALHYPIKICNYGPTHHDGPTLKDNDFVIRFALRLVHVHHDHTSFGFDVGGEVFLDKGKPDDFQGVSIATVITPVL